MLEETDVETAKIGITEEARTTSIKYQEHVPCSYGYKLVSDISKFQPGFKSELRADASEVFLDEMISLADYFITKNLLQPKRKPRLSELMAFNLIHFVKHKGLMRMKNQDISK